MKKGKWAGLVLVLAVILIAGSYVFFKDNQPQKAELSGLLGGEKIGLFESQDFQKHMDRGFALRMNYRKAGSFAMVEETAKNKNETSYDYLFPASQLAAQYYKKLGGSSLQEDIIFNSPIVLYSRKPVVDALKKLGIVTERNAILYVNMEKLATLIADGTSWAKIGLPQLYGNIFVDTTDPKASNSGNIFLGLLANALNGNKVVTGESLPAVLPKIMAIYQQIGNMQTSSSDMFSQFLKLGMGSYPIIAGYENQILELSKTDPQVFDQIKEEVLILYPEPTVWSSHVYIALSKNGQRGLEALKDPETQKMAWKNHGFRTIVSGTADPKEFSVKGLPATIDQVMPMPDIDVMLRLMKAIDQ